MTRDMILVEREYDGEKCGENCSLSGLDSHEDPVCDLDGMPFNFDERYNELRTAACLATPPARVLTPEMLALVRLAVEHLEGKDADDHVAERLCAAFGIEEGEWS